MKPKVTLARPTRKATTPTSLVGSPAVKKEKEPGNNLGTPLPLFRGEEGVPVLPRTPEVEEERKGRILSELAALSSETRQQILDQLALQQISSKSRNKDMARDLEMWSTAVYDALVELLGAGGSLGVGPLIVRRLLGSGSCWQPVEAFMRTSKLLELDVQGRQKVYRTLAGLLVRHARKIARRSEIPLSPKLVGNCAPELPGIFEQAFPGYIKAGLARVVATQSLQ